MFLNKPQKRVVHHAFMPLPMLFRQLPRDKTILPNQKIFSL